MSEKKIIVVTQMKELPRSCKCCDYVTYDFVDNSGLPSTGCLILKRFLTEKGKKIFRDCPLEVVEK